MPEQPVSPATERHTNTSPDELANFLRQAGVPKSVFFYIILGIISGARKLLGKAVDTADPATPMASPQQPPMAPPRAPMPPPAPSAPPKP